ncbi:MAG TPA: alpha-galactosidase [Anaerolineaceae bacterium]|nr:alpha-galactosidase [Anaerolineaceae bacterium]
MEVKLTPHMSVVLSEGGLPIGSVGFRVWARGVDLLGENLPGQRRVLGNSLTWSIPMGEWGSWFCEVLSNQPAADRVILACSLTNTGSTDLVLDGLELPRLEFDPHTFDSRSGLWSLQGAAVRWGQDFAFELPLPFQRENYLGHLQDAEGGGIPVNTIWKKGLGAALMHIEPVPQEWYMPLAADERGVRTGLEYRAALRIHPGEKIKTPTAVISVHHGDFFEPLDLYRCLMEAQQVHPAISGPACFEPAWCSWGYGFDISGAQMLGVTPMLDRLGIRWMTLDDRWFDAYGDWNPRKDTFPGGGDELKQMNDRLHEAGYKNQVWWYPLCAEDGHGEWDSHRYIVSELIQEHPDWVALHADGTVARNNRHLAMLCPALPEVQKYTRELTLRMIRDWDFDGHKLDNIYTMPACHNPAHHHKRPEESVEAFGRVFQQIFAVTLELKPDAVIQICPCGTPLLHSLMPATNQTVTADPTSSQQIRQRIKFYKGLMGPHAAVFADHVELSDEGRDFASEIGTGGVPGTKFVYPDDPELKAEALKTGGEYWDLPPEKYTLWKKWIDRYDRYRLAEGEYLNLYDLAFDSPEAHVIRKGSDLFYAFYAEEHHGEVELRGLENRAYRLTDYEEDREIGVLPAGQSRLAVNFKGHLLLRASPED